MLTPTTSNTREEMYGAAVELAIAGSDSFDEPLWRAALDAGVKLYAVASDDARDYGVETKIGGCGDRLAVPDRGWIRVHARNEASSIRAAIERGDFYAVTADGGPWEQP